MWELVVNSLIVLLMISSVVHAIICWVGRVDLDRGTTGEKLKVTMLGFHTPSSVKRYVRPTLHASALTILWLRNFSLVLLVLISVVYSLAKGI